MRLRRRFLVATLAGLGVCFAAALLYLHLDRQAQRRRAFGKLQETLFSGGLGLIWVDGRWGYISRAGTVAIEPVFSDLGPFSEGLAFARLGEECGYIDKSEKFVIRLESIDEAQGFSSGLAAIRRDGKWGYIGRDGRIRIEPQFLEAYEFSDGLALVSGADGRGRYVNPNGEFIGGNQFEGGGSFVEGLAPARIGAMWGFINPSGRFVIPARFDTALPFSGGVACVVRSGTILYIDKTGKPVLQTPPNNVVPGYFSEGFSRIGTRAGSRCAFGYIDIQGRIVVPPRFERSRRFSEGLAAVRCQGKWGYIDSKGSFVIPPQYHFAGTFSEGLACVGTDNGYGYIDKVGKFVWASATTVPALPSRGDLSAGEEPVKRENEAENAAPEAPAPPEE